MRYRLILLFVFFAISASAQGMGDKLISDLTSVFSIEIFLQGFAFTTCLSIGLFLILTDQRSHFSGVNDFGTYVWKLKLLAQLYVRKVSLGVFINLPPDTNKAENLRSILVIRTIGIAIAFLTLIIISGVIINTSSDVWMREKSAYHFGLKDFWLDEDIAEAEQKYDIDTYKAVKVATFEEIIGDIGDTTLRGSAAYQKKVNEFYYQAWHELISKVAWRDYLMSTHNLVDITESFALSFFVLFTLAYINFLINLFRDFHAKMRQSIAAIFLPFAFFIILNIVSALIENPVGITIIFCAIPFVCQLIISFLYDRRLAKPNVVKSITGYYSLTSVLVICGSCALYLLSSAAYTQNSKLLCRKTLGIYRYADEQLRRQTRNSVTVIVPGYKAEDPGEESH